MSDITGPEKAAFSKLFGMKEGHFLNESHASLNDLIAECSGVDFEDKKYLKKGTSKGNKIRSFWEIESNEVVGKTLICLINYYYEKYDEWDIDEDELIKCYDYAEKIKDRNHEEHIIIEKTGNEELNILIDEIISSIKEDRAIGSLDRFHTLLIKYMKRICKRHAINISENDPLNSILGKYVNDIKEKGLIKSDFTKTLMLQSVSLFEKFNYTRNHQSLAHDNKFLNNAESKLILKYMLATKEFIDVLEKERNI
ncbi:hypothetical protein [Methanobrevibacter sp.]|uniref:hypothetical protein n=1 Tax=Methanobrevibacter sp. TaxID=66852 RepID=UPI00262A94FE|nr:hypothetical protein [uncultured Methanobrevibacter sp.]